MDHIIKISKILQEISWGGGGGKARISPDISIKKIEKNRPMRWVGRWQNAEQGVLNKCTTSPFILRLFEKKYIRKHVKR